MEIAPLRETLMSGYSSAPSSEAEYTEAPASLTTMYCTGRSVFLSISATNCSDSREAVPLPMEMMSTLYFSIMPSKIFSDFATSFFGSVG